MWFLGLCKLLGGISIFMLGLKFLGQNFSKVLNQKFKNGIKIFTKSRLLSAFIGAVTTSIMQSSVAVNMMVISLVEGGVITFLSACAIIVGTNIGTTITAQIVSLSFAKNISFVAIGSLICFLGFCLGESSKPKVTSIGNMLLGFGMVFVGIDIMTNALSGFYNYQWFVNFFLIDSPVLLVFNGFFITAICQSSSVVTSMLVILANGGVITAYRSVFIILGANIGASVGVIIATGKLSVTSQKTAWFNFVFNFIGALMFFIITIIFNNQLKPFLNKVRGPSFVANFHTIFNLVIGIISLPFLKQLAFLSKKIVGEGNYYGSINQATTKYRR